MDHKGPVRNVFESDRFFKTWPNLFQRTSMDHRGPLLLIFFFLLVIALFDCSLIFVLLLTSSVCTYSRVRNKHTPTFINFWIFLQGLWSYYGLNRLKFYNIRLHILKGYVYSFCQIFQRLCLFKGVYSRL
jgi:hypothetical protein